MDKPGFVVITGKIMAIGIIVLFLVVIFVLCLHLYAKCFWWRIEEQPTPHPSRRNRRRFVFASGGATKGLDSTILASLPALIFNQNEFKEGFECAVCLCELVEGEKARLLPKCNHGFHVECIDMWFQSHSTCPLCRNPIVGVEKEDPNHVISGDELNVQVQIQSPNDGHSSDSPSFPTNVLFWGNHTQVSSGSSALEDGASLGSSSMVASGSSSSRHDDGDVSVNVNEGFTEEESKSLPLPTRLRSLKRLLSREKRVVQSTSGSSSVDV